ncbi:hypothetical protein B0T18DRAFT_430151 [Schizothecium vesticola]|uniref:Uncharacterized protein n=1 Tax=Schizothecium vesticola TaxID=314040 RepID=A0AA40ENU0_9PEZI|nr:hypothetical protein B0T18DRAFT_430151 [Schizothecium vesticola]
MSGGPLEIAGVLLGGLPLLIFALETRTALRRWRRPELHALARGLRTEQARLRNVLEKLLRDIVADALIQPMIEDPFGCALWGKPAVVEKVKRRLGGGRDYELFGECLEAVREVVGELRGLLVGEELRGVKQRVMAQGIQIVVSSASVTGWGSSLALCKVRALTAVISTRCRASGMRAARKFTLPPPGEDDLVAVSGSKVNSTLLAVGVLLIEVALGESVVREGGWYRGLLTAAADAEEGRRGSLMERVNTLSSSGYYGVVRTCVAQGMAREESGGQPAKDVLVEIIVS